MISAAVIAVLNIVPTVGTDTRAGFVPKTEWAVNDAMGRFMYKATGWGDAYPRYDAQNNKSTKTAAGWSQAKPVYLLSDKATIWAYYPYNQVVPSMREPLSTTCGERAQTRCRSLKRMPSFP